MNTTPLSTKLTARAGLSIAAGMLLVACGGNDDPAPSAQQQQPSTQGTPASTAPPIVQPVWGSMGVLVAAGQASKVMSFADGACTTFSAGESTNLFNASFTIAANGDVSFRASDSAGATATERFAITLSQSTERNLSLNANSTGLTYAEYRYRAQAGSSIQDVNLYAGEGQRLVLTLGNRTSFTCQDGPITFANLTPAAAYVPSEARTAAGFLSGVTSSSNGGLSNGVFSWSNFGARVADRPNGVPPGSAINLTSGQLRKGAYDTATNTLLASPAPTPVTFSSALQGGSYYESYLAPSVNNGVEYRRADLYINSASGSDSFRLTRRGTVVEGDPGT